MPQFFRPFFNNGTPGYPWIKPDVHNVIFFSDMARTAFGTFETFGQKFRRRAFHPSIRAFFFKYFCNVFNRGIVYDNFIAIFTVENRDRHTPCSLAGNTPVRSVFNHIWNSLFAACRNEFHIFNRIKGLFAEFINLYKPLGRCPVDYRVFTSPTMGVAVVNIRCSKQCARILKFLNYDFISLVIWNTL